MQKQNAHSHLALIFKSESADCFNYFKLCGQLSRQFKLETIWVQYRNHVTHSNPTYEIKSWSQVLLPSIKR